MFYNKVKDNKIIRKILDFTQTPFYVGMLALIAFVAHCFGWDFFGFYTLMVLAIINLLFNPDTKPLIPTLCFLLFCVSVQNGPTNAENSPQMYRKLSTIIQLVIILAPIIVLIIARLIAAGEFKSYMKGSTVIGGLIAMSLGLLVNGAFFKEYHILNLVMGLAFAFLFLGIYLFFYRTMQWDSRSINYLAWIMFIMGLLISAQIGVRYITCEELRLTFEKNLVTLGWSASNSIAYVLLLTLPFGFYFMKKARFGFIFYILTFIIFTAIILTFSRGVLVVSVPLSIALAVFTCFTGRDKLSPIIMTSLVIVGATVLMIVWREEVFKILNFYIETGFDDRGRGGLIIQGFNDFLLSPIFGVGVMYKFGDYFTSFIWYHNTLIQFLATGGIIGIGTYVYHRVESVALFFKKPTMGRMFIGLSMGALLVNSLFDVGMSMPHVILFYSILLAFADRDYRFVCEEFKKQEMHDIELQKNKPIDPSVKPRVLFPFVEAGMGHIVPMLGVVEVFEKKYGDKVEIIKTSFYKDTNTESMLKFQKLLVNEVRKHNKIRGYAFLSFITMDLFNRLALMGIMEWFVKYAYADSMAYIEKLHPDLVFSTHWATSYCATRMSEKPINLQYCPDVRLDVLWNTGSDTIFMPAKSAVARARKKHAFAYSDIRPVPFIIRKEAFGLSKDKKVNRVALGLNQDNFTVTLADGGYGAGKLHSVVMGLLSQNVPMTVVAICGKNQALYERLKLLTVNPNIQFVPLGYTNEMLKYIAASDLFVGKSGASSMLEPRYFGVPQLITMYATLIEKANGRYYIKEVGSAIKEFSAKKAVKRIIDFAQFPPKLEPYKANALNGGEYNGAEVISDFIYEKLKEKFTFLE